MSLSNTFEAGSDGLTFVAGSGGNTGGGPNSDNYFDSQTLITGGTLEFAAAAAYAGSLGMRTQVGATTGGALSKWTGSFPSSIDTYGRAYIRVTALPSVAGLFLQWITDDQTTTVFQLRLNSAGKIELRASSTTLATSVTTLVAGQWYRIEWHVHADATSPSAELRIYTNPSAPIASYDESITVTPNATANVGTIEFGPSAVTNWPSATDYFDFDSIEAAATTWVGPYVGPLNLTPATINATSTVTGKVAAKHLIRPTTVSATSTVRATLGTLHSGSVVSTYGAGTFGKAIYGSTGAPAAISGFINAKSTVSGGITKAGSPGGGPYTPPYTPPTPPPAPIPGVFGPFAQAVYDELNVDVLTA